MPAQRFSYPDAHHRNHERGHWHILGPGAIGGLMACLLDGTGTTVTLIPRQSPSDGYLTLQLEHQERLQTHRLSTSDAQENAEIDHLLITTKAYDALPAVQNVAHRLHDDSQILLMINGMGVAEEIQTALPEATLFLGTTTEGAYRQSPQHIVHAGRGETRIGGHLKRPPDWFLSWTEALGQCMWDTDIQDALWRKLAINCAINPLTVRHDCQNGELDNTPALRREVSQLCNEIAEICAAAGHTRLAEELHDQVIRVIRGTAANHSSMLQDSRNGRRTEIDYINGYLMQVAHSAGIAAPINRSLYEEITHDDH